ncbi:TolC family protein [Bremerella sp. T1]|uniref:TolC family protein n=1 Tax=Bremerella sp. TYQ1 TaxID=3119568 RepID=UPI001CCC3D31|nr:TolC family protein [Bremerella volcania]UBM36404.1 TolC family protein [Bremerella volcania]
MAISKKTFQMFLIAAIGGAGLAGCVSDRARDYSSLVEVPPVQPAEVEPKTSIAKDSTVTLPTLPADDLQLVSHLQDADIELASAESIHIPDVPSEANGITLKAIQDLALLNNPSVRAMSATAQAESDYQYQVGRKANPEVGYMAVQLADQGTDQHLLYVEREFVTGGKLQLNQNVLGHSAEAFRWDVESQRYRVLTDVRLKFTQALVAQRQMELIDGFSGVLEKGIDLAQRRLNAKEGTQTDLLQSRIQLNEVEVMRQQAEYRWKAAWQEMAAAAGVPDMAPTRLAGELDPKAGQLAWDDVYGNLLSSSPELRAAESRVRLAQCNLSRQEVQTIPNVTANLQSGVDNATGSGLIQLQVGAPIPVYNKNRGNVSAAYNEFSRATHEVKRIEMSLKSRLAQVSQEYDSAKFAVQRYEEQILPMAKETLDLAEQAYGAGEYSFIQTLIARRTYFDTNIGYLNSLGNLAQAHAKVDGLLLTGALDPSTSTNLGDGLRGQTFSQQ